MDTGHLKIIEVKKVAKKHKEGLVDLINAYLLDEMGERRALPQGVQKRLASQLFNYPGALVFFAESKKKLIGLAVCFIGFSTFYARKIINIHDLVVLPEYRGQGVAGKILAAVENKARKIGCCKLTLEVRTDNEKGMRLYKRCGFSEGKHPMYSWVKMLQQEDRGIGEKEVQHA